MLEPLRHSYLTAKLWFSREFNKPRPTTTFTISRVKSKPGTCTLCSYSDQEAVNSTVLSVSCREAARIYGIGKSSVSRHRRHIPNS